VSAVSVTNELVC